jgi:hypothetical protein
MDKGDPAIGDILFRFPIPCLPSRVYLVAFAGQVI